MSFLRRVLARNHSLISLNKYENCAAIFVLTKRKISIAPYIYDGDDDPAGKFFSAPVQALLKSLTRPDFAKVFRKRNHKGYEVLKTPKYKFLTDEELNLEMQKTLKKAEKLLQMPPVVKVHKHIEEILSRDPALTGYDTAKYVFTDITFGISNEERVIVERDLDGTLKNADHETRKRLNQAYFPITGRKISEPKMFTEEDLLHSLLARDEHEYVLDRACVQYDPDEPAFQRVASTVYQHLDHTRKYHLLRSTRHFGPMAFFLAWTRGVDGLVLALLQDAAVREAVCVVALRHAVQGDVADGDAATALADQLMRAGTEPSKQEQLTEEDIELDSRCIEVIARYVAANSAMKSHHELALQGYRETHRRSVELARGVRKAHGNA